MKLKSIYIALGLSLLLSGCKSEEPAPQVQGEMNLPVSFTIQLAVESGATRAGEGTTWNGDEDADPVPGTETGSISQESGTDFDNTINSITAVLYFVVGGEMKTNHPVASMTLAGDELKNNITQTSTSGVYTITGNLKSDSWTAEMLMNENNSYRLALFLNCAEGDVIYPLNIVNPATATFNHHGKPGDFRDEETEHFHAIPMYGVSNVKFEKVENEDDPAKQYRMKIVDRSNKDANIDILRSMAKVRVKLSESLSKKVELEELYISRHAVRGYVVPKFWNLRTSVADLVNGQAMNALTGPTDGGFYNHDCTVKPQNKANGNDSFEHDGGEDYHRNTTELLRFYLPDTYNYRNDEDDSSKEIYLRLKYKVEGSDTYTHYLWLRPFSEWPSSEDSGDGTPNIYPASDKNNPWDIIRNHIYEFVIEGVEDNGSLNVEVCVKPWNYKIYNTEL